jgi:DNA polymerase elongation subunit (family B)
MKANIVGLDIETFPHIVYSWQTFSKYPWTALKIIRPSYLLCIGVKVGASKTQVFALPDYKSYKEDTRDDRELVKELHQILCDADIVWGWNSKKFDIKKLYAKFLEYGLPPVSPFKQVDVMQEWNKLAKDGSSKLNDVAERLGYGHKVDHEGFPLWESCDAGEQRAWRKMIRYCKRDVDLTYKIYKHLRPHMANHPNVNHYSRDIKACSACGKHNTLIRNGWRPAGQRRRQLYRCAPSRGGCGKYCSGELIPQDPNTKLIIVK